jgi:anhydro-N-acetylmuramic acid kinase
MRLFLMHEYYIGLMSGTSADALDGVLVDFAPEKPRIEAYATMPWSQATREQIAALSQPGFDEMHGMQVISLQYAEAAVEVVHELLAKSRVQVTDVVAIGSHGQNVRHCPNALQPYTLQVGDANRIAYQTGIVTVADFRSKDICAGGQGAPLTPAFHQAVFSQDLATAIINLGGIANITFLPGKDSDLPVLGFDTGPANGLLDAWVTLHWQQPFDCDGALAATGECLPDLLALLSADSYFTRPIPKSTGREYFNLAWVEQCLEGHELPLDVLSTLTELTAWSITTGLSQLPREVTHLYLCGGGVHNITLIERLQRLNPDCAIATTAKLGIDPQWVEATAFAWLARQTMLRRPGNLPAVTGARQSVVLGALYYP